MARSIPEFKFAATFVAVLIVLGCESTPTTSGLNAALADYHSGRFAAAYIKADHIQKRSTGESKREAAYLAGLSAYQSGNLAEAANRFQTARLGSTAPTNANANAMLGLVRLKQDRPAEAAQLLSDASRKMGGTDARQAAYHAQQAYQMSGNDGRASQLFAISDRRGTNSTNHHVSESAHFDLQVGAFRQRLRAESAAREATMLGRPHGLGPARVVSSEDRRGRTVFQVRLGQFRSRQAAAEMRSKLGRLKWIVATAVSGAVRR